MDNPIKTILLVGFALLALAGAASGFPTVSVTNNTGWLTAGGSETATVTVAVDGSVEGAHIILSSGDPEMGSIVPGTLPGTGGTAIFKAGTKSGDVTITANYAAQNGTVIAAGNVTLKIDHGVPYSISSLDYADEVTAGSTTSLILRMADRWNNPIESRRTAETVHFVVGSPGDAARLIYGSNASTDLRVPVDAHGEVRVDLRTAPLSGANIVMVECPGTISIGYITVTGTATGVPWEMYQTITPDDDPHPYQQADGKKVFSIVYSLYDRHGNVAGNRQIHVRIVPQEGYLKAVEKTVRTNEEGKAMISYGPSDVAGIADIEAYAVDNDTLTCSKRLEFVSTDPTAMLLSASPQTVASRDVKSDISALIRAKVVDVKGNPVADESVSFTITAVQNGTFVMTQDPAITDGVLTAGLGGSPIVASTDNAGFATVNFLPGAFTTDISNPRYSNLSVGEATVRASWKDQTQDITVSFRNYPYLSVKTWAEPPTVAVNDTVNVTVQLIGDGYALHARPIDVVLCTDRSGSMLLNTTEVSGYDKYDSEWISQESVDDRMVHAMAAAKNFVSQMQSSKDRIGLVSFGQRGTADLDSYSYKYWAGNDYKWEKRYSWYGSYWKWCDDSSDDATYIAAHYYNPRYYSDDATRDLELTRDYRNVNTTIEHWLPCGGTPMREGLYRAVRMILENSRTTGDEPVKAIVLLTDGEWNTGGNPEGGDSVDSFSGVGQGSVIQYAKNSGIKIFTIALGNEPNHDELQSYADQTDGKFYSATAGDDLTLIYDDIALKLQEAAGVNTTMSLVFKNVEVNNVSGYSDVFEYQPINGASTFVTKYWQTNLTTVQDKDHTYPYSFDQTNDWADDEISFKVGDIYLNQAWETTFCLKITEEGNIDIFGPNSIIRFNGTEGRSNLSLPKTLVTAVKDLNVTALDQGVVNVTIVSATWDGVSFLVPTWELRYSGNESIVQNLYYQYSPDNLWWDGVWNHFDTIRCGPAAVNGTYSSNLLVEGVNGWYKVRVHAQEDVPGGASGLDTRTQPIRVGNLTQNKIKLL